ncbi:MAG: rRNA maturation RNase YbeY [Nitrospirae bacterium]|nr:rRNA maturation RNase YbeY [Nitrospirota bacterium]
MPVVRQGSPQVVRLSLSRATSRGSPQVLVRSWLRCVSLRHAEIETTALRVLEAAGDSGAELSLVLVGDRRMRRLNRRYRGRDHPTDVLAFPMRASSHASRVTRHPSPVTPEILGDVVISLHTAARQAKAAGQSLDHEVVTLIIHGVLHLFGYDHERGEREARRMRRKEQAILQSLLPLPKLFR